jgi:hypothetical protein
LCGDSVLDPLAHPYSNPSLTLTLKFEHAVRRPWFDRYWLADVIDGDENDWALGGLSCRLAGRAAGVDGNQDVHAAASGIGEAGVYLDDLTNDDRPAQVKVSQ